MQCVDDHQRWKKGYEEKERNSFNNTQKVKLGFENNMAEEDSFQIESSCKQETQPGSQLGNQLTHQPGSQAGSQQQSMNLIQEDDSKFEKILKQLVQVEETNKENDEQFDKALYCFGFEQYGDVAFIEPCEDTEDKKKLDTLVIAIDTSGSCQGEVVDSFLKAMKALLYEIEAGYTIEHIVLLQCDAKIQEERSFISIQDFMSLKELTLKGFGWTDFRPVFERVNQLSKQEKIGALLYFSDGMGTFPQQETAYKTVFLLEDDMDSYTSIPNWIETYYLRRKKYVNSTAG